MTDLESEISNLMIESLNLEIWLSDIDPEAPLHGASGLGLDSIDLLELSVVLSQRYGFQIKFDDPKITDIFSSITALAQTISEKRTL